MDEPTAAPAVDGEIQPYTPEEWAALTENPWPTRMVKTIDVQHAMLQEGLARIMLANLYENILANLLKLNGPGSQITVTAQNLAAADKSQWKINVSSDGRGGITITLQEPQKKILIARGL